MGDTRREVAIDADLFRNFTNEGASEELFMKVMAELNYSPVMHKYVYEYELSAFSLVKKLYAENKLKIYEEKDFIPVGNEEAYEARFKDGYFLLNYKNFDEAAYNADVYTYRHEKENLGELRTGLMALYMKIDIIFSDDNGAKNYVKKRLSNGRHRINVYNTFDTLVLIHKNNCNIGWQEVKGMAKRVFEKKPSKYKELNEIWHAEKE